MARTYSIARLKAGLSSILSDVKNGEEVLVTDHNKPVARLLSLSRLPPLPSGEMEALLADRPLSLKKGAPPSSELVRRMRDEETH